MQLSKGDIVLYPFPFSDQSQNKLRPSLVLSQKIQGDILLCQITSVNSMNNNFCIKLNTNDTLSGKLRVDSYIKANKLFTANNKEIIKHLCKIKTKKYQQVVEKIISLISNKY